MTDPLSDMINRIKNGLNAKLESVDLPHSALKEGIARILVAEGWLAKYEVFKRMNKQQLRLQLKYRANRSGVIVEIKRVSKPGRRVYREVKQIKRVQAGFGTMIVSTSQGLLTDEQARAKKIGGEILCQVW